MELFNTYLCTRTKMFELSHIYVIGIIKNQEVASIFRNQVRPFNKMPCQKIYIDDINN